MTSSGSDLIAAIAPIATFLQETAEAVDAESRAGGAWDVRQGTHWHRELAEQVRGPSGYWPDGAKQVPVALASLYLAAAVQHIKNLGILYEGGGLLLSPELLVRSTVELSAQIAWMFDPTTAIKHRIARAFLDRIHVTQSALLPYARLGGKAAGSTHAELKASRDRTVGELQGLFDEAEMDIDLAAAESDWELAGQRLPSPTTLARRLGGLSGLGEDQVEAVYAFLSSYTHPNAVELSLRLGSESQGDTSGSLEVDPRYLRNLASVALKSFHYAYRQFAAYLGWSQQAFEAWEGQYAKVFPASFEGKQ